MSTTTTNETWGFFGTLVSFGASNEEAREEFAKMVGLLAKRFNVANTDARDYLDSRYGRHLADAICDAHGKPTKALPKWLSRSFYRYINSV